MVCSLVHLFLCNVTDPAMEYNYGYPVMEKRTASRPTLSDYLRLAAIQYEMDKEEDEAADAQNAGTLHSAHWDFYAQIVQNST